MNDGYAAIRSCSDFAALEACKPNDGREDQLDSAFGGRSAGANSSIAATLSPAIVARERSSAVGVSRAPYPSLTAAHCQALQAT